MSRRLGAGLAGAEDGDVVEVGLEAGLMLQGAGERVHVLLSQLAHSAAGTADQVVVSMRAEPLEQVVAGAEVGLADQTQLFGRRKSPIDGRSIYVGIGASH